MTSMASGAGGSDLFQGLAFRQIVEVLESQDVAMPLGAVDTGDLVQRFSELADVGVRDVTIEGMHGDVAGRIYRGLTRPGAGLVWVHGGAFVGGDLDMPEAHWVSLAIVANGFPVLSLDYRKALRGVHYPAPSDDVLAGWLWATTHADELGVAVDDCTSVGPAPGATSSPASRNDCATAWDRCRRHSCSCTRSSTASCLSFRQSCARGWRRTKPQCRPRRRCSAR